MDGVLFILGEKWSTPVRFVVRGCPTQLIVGLQHVKIVQEFLTLLRTIECYLLLGCAENKVCPMQLA
jgi:hypothetical protein